jgi:pyruvate/2-oxoglutarate dehydrogenase complex dihydrolipoamide dehydrogenase (E3) component
VETVEYDLAALAGTYVLRRDYRGRAKLVVDRSAGVVVGATFVGVGIAELVHSATTAIVGRIPLSTLWHVVPVIRRRVRSGCVCLRRCAGNATRPYGNDTPGGGDASRRT